MATALSGLLLSQVLGAAAAVDEVWVTARAPMAMRELRDAETVQLGSRRLQDLGAASVAAGLAATCREVLLPGNGIGAEGGTSQQGSDAWKTGIPKKKVLLRLVMKWGISLLSLVSTLFEGL